MTDFIRFAASDGVARLTFDNPRRLNAINAEMWQALPALLTRVEEDPAIRVLVLAGTGDRAFCTGNDISEFGSIRADPIAAERYNEGQRAVAGKQVHVGKGRALVKHRVCALTHGFLDSFSYDASFLQ